MVSIAQMAGSVFAAASSMVVSCEGVPLPGATMHGKGLIGILSLELRHYAHKLVLSITGCLIHHDEDKGFWTTNSMATNWYAFGDSRR
jgi:hypothetical protein